MLGIVIYLFWGGYLKFTVISREMWEWGSIVVRLFNFLKRSLKLDICDRKFIGF